MRTLFDNKIVLEKIHDSPIPPPVFLVLLVWTIIEIEVISFQSLRISPIPVNYFIWVKN